MTRCDSLDALFNIINGLSDDAVEVLLEVASGLDKGNGLYGPLNINDNPRDWLREALDESRDLAVYLAIALIQMMRRRRGEQNDTR